MDLHEEIAKLAYELYEKGGRVEGRNLDNWLEAERIIKSLQTAATRRKSKAVELPQKSATSRKSTKKAGKK
jgi:hypothetical protein